MPTTSFQDATFGARAIGNRTDSSGTAAVDLTAEEDRFDNLDIGEGFITPADSFLVAAATVWNVDIGSGTSDTDLYIVEGELPGQGNYIVRLDQAGASITLTAADGSNPRKDEIWLLVADIDYDGGSVSLPRLALRTGDAAASPVAPGPDAAWDSAVLLATIDLPTAAANIGACTITDERAKAALVIDAPTLDGQVAEDFALSGHDHDANYAPIAHEDDRVGHPLATPSTSGFISASDFSKLDGIEANAEANRTSSELLTAIKTVDGPGSGIDADLLDGIHGSGFSLAGHDHDSRYYTKLLAGSIWASKADVAEAVMVYRSGAAVAVSSGSNSAFAMDGTYRDDWNGHTPIGGVITADGTGLYLVEMQVSWGTGTTGIRQCTLTHSVDGIVAVSREQAANSTYNKCSAIVYCVGTPTITANVYHEQGSNVSYNPNSSWMSMLKLGGG